MTMTTFPCPSPWTVRPLLDNLSPETAEKLKAAGLTIEQKPDGLLLRAEYFSETHLKLLQEIARQKQRLLIVEGAFSSQPLLAIVSPDWVKMMDTTAQQATSRAAPGDDFKMKQIVRVELGKITLRFSFNFSINLGGKP